MRAVRAAVAAGVGGLVGTVLGQVHGARRRPYLPDPDYVVDGVVWPTVGDTEADPLRLFVMGDSTAAGVGSETAEESLPMLLATRVAAACGRPVAVRGLGVSGARTADLVRLQAPALRGEDPDVVVAVIGANDVTHVAPPWRMRRRTMDLVRAVEPPLVVCGIPLFRVRALGRPLRDLVQAYAWVLRAVQRRAVLDAGAAYVDIARLASPRFAGVPEAMSADQYHPSPIGYGFWCDAIAPVVARYAPAS